ncbi:MAG TPA: thioredoxin domain-containing protein [Steroidobacteraceae bacterium]
MKTSCPGGGSTPPKCTNRLASETSPYLQQHAQNPVDWFPWGDAAFEQARRENKPVHVSIGYAACHWCHAMAHESFEDPDTAKLMNELFVNIKVDREERPDIDRIYQIAQQMLTQRSGGWPLTMFLTPDDRRPFFGGTYFPRESRHGLPGFRQLLPRIAAFYHEHESELRRQSEALMSAFAELTPPAAAPDTLLTDAPLQEARAQLARTFDSRYGGFGGAPKFPHPRILERLLRDWHASAHQPEPDQQALHMATLTLRRMADGGIHDQLGGGFSRYSVDEQWMIPHFEKMLYDNAALLAVYAGAALATADSFYADVASRTADWAIREMQSPEGGYYSSFDADSEGHEGKFYVWDRGELQQALSEAEYRAFAARFALDAAPNFEARWHLHVHRPVEDIARNLHLPPEAVQSALRSARNKLLAIRSQRVWPARDEKILTSWNALMIRAMAVAARALAREDLAASATQALDFIRSTLWKNGRLLATYKDGRAHLNAYLDDYVFLADAVLELQQLRFRSAELDFARELLDAVLEHFADPTGGFFFTSDDHESLIHRSKTFSDDATPAGNAVAAFVLQRMGFLLGESRYLMAAEQTLRAGWLAMEKYPHAHTSLLDALEESLHPPEIIILRGPEDEISKWARELHKLYAPRRLLLAIPSDATGLPQALADKVPVAAKGSTHDEVSAAAGASPDGTAAPTAAIAYICRGTTCSAPVRSLGSLISQLQAGALLAPDHSGTRIV